MTQRLFSVSLGLVAFAIALLGLWPRAGHEANTILLIMLTLLAAGQTAWHWRSALLSRLFLGAALAINTVLIGTFLLPESWVSADHWRALLAGLPGDWYVANIRPPMLILLACLGLSCCALLRMRLGYGAATLLAQTTLVLIFTIVTPSEQSLASMPLIGMDRLTLLIYLAILLLAQWLELLPALTRTWRDNLVPLMIASGITFICLLAWQHQSRNENERIAQETYILGDRIATQLSSEVEGQLAAMRRFAKLWSLMGQTSAREEWERLARNYYIDFSHFMNIAFIDRDSVIKLVFPDEGKNHELLGVRLFDAQPDSPLRNPLELGIEGHTGIIDLLQGSKGMVSYLPVRAPRDDDIFGAIAMVVDLDSLLDHALRAAHSDIFAITLSERGQVFAHVGPESRLAPWGHQIPIELPASNLMLSLQPTQNFLTVSRGRLPEAILLTGIMLAYLVFMVLYMYRHVFQEHRIVEQANNGLKEEMVRREKLQNQLQWLARHDELTRLPNRHFFLEKVHLFKEQMPLTIMILDIDFFKSINDKLGHLEGDRYLQTVASVLKMPVESSGGVLARFGGEEFVVFLPDCPRAVGRIHAEELRRKVQAAGLPQPATDSVVTVSIGMACLAKGPFALESLLQAADEALYRAKSSGRNQIQVAD
ncbi:GGDEF domain-containing protein [Cobetia marina]|uniref:GGDEF domain-containing protein n=1 Tax=Cobetia marina TaxID=28258 RepID=UPI00174EC40C